MTTKATRSQIHGYYTPKTNKMQGFLVIFTFFVDYAYFYVNMIMSTKTTSKRLKYSNNIHIQRCWVWGVWATTKYCFCKLTCKNMQAGKLHLPTCEICTNYRYAFFRFTLNWPFFAGRNATIADPTRITTALTPIS